MKEPQGLATGRREERVRGWAVAVLLGIAAGAINLVPVPILTEETPLFLFGGALVLVAFMRLGPVHGLVAGVLSIAPNLSAGFTGAVPLAAGIGTAVYLVEGLVAWWLHRRLHSLAVAVPVFWFSVGWIWDAVVFGAWLGLEPGYVILLFVKQLVNGILNGAVAELVLIEWSARKPRGRRPSVVSIARFIQSRVVLLSLLPLTLLALLYARAQYIGVLRDAQAVSAELALDVAREVRELTLSDPAATPSADALRRAAARVDDPDATGRRLVAVVGEEGSVVAATTPFWVPGRPLSTGVLDAAGRPFAQVPPPDAELGSFVHYLPVDDGQDRRLALNIGHGTWRPIFGAPGGVFVSLPATVLYPRFVPVAWEIIGLVALLVFAIVTVVGRLSRSVGFPIRTASASALDIAAGRLEDTGTERGLRRSALREIRALARSLARMRRQLRAKETRTRVDREELEAQLLHAQKMEAVGLLAGGVAHDFNNLLTPVIGFASLGSADSEGELQEYFTEIQKAADRGKDLVGQLLAFSRGQPLEARIVDLRTELSDVRSLLRRLIRENVDLQMVVSERDLRVRADPTQINQILVNLAVNAQDAMPRGGRLSFSLGTVDETPEHSTGAGEDADHGWVELAVTDEGRGITPEQMTHIFDPFYTTKARGRGSGLGLATVYGIVTQHGGRIAVESVPGEGTTFRIFLPAAGPDPDDGPIG